MKKKIIKTKPAIYFQVLRKAVILASSLLLIININAQFDKLVNDSAVGSTANGSGKKHIIELVKTKNNKSIYFKEGSTVWIMCETKKGKNVTQRAKITEISDYSVTFLPNNKKFPEVTYKVNELPYIGYTTPGREVLAITSGLLILPVNLILIVGSAFTGSYVGPYFYLYPARKNAYLRSDAIVDNLWEIRIIDEDTISNKRQRS